MNRTIAALILAILGVSCSAPENPMNWAFVQSVGGIAVNQPIVLSDKWVLPLTADVSGLRAITTKPTRMNSGLSCQSVRAQVNGSAIYLTIMAAVAEPESKSECPPAEVGALASGKYTVFYKGPSESPVQIGEVSVSR